MTDSGKRLLDPAVLARLATLRLRVRATADQQQFTGDSCGAKKQAHARTAELDDAGGR